MVTWDLRFIHGIFETLMKFSLIKCKLCENFLRTLSLWGQIQQIFNREDNRNKAEEQHLQMYSNVCIKYFTPSSSIVPSLTFHLLMNKYPLPSEKKRNVPPHTDPLEEVSLKSIIIYIPLNGTISIRCKQPKDHIHSNALRVQQPEIIEFFSENV